MIFKNFTDHHKTGFSKIDSAMKTAYKAGKKGESDLSSLYETAFTSRDEHVFHLKAKIGENESKLLELSKERDALQKDFTENFLETNKDDLMVTGFIEAKSYTEKNIWDYLVYILFFAEFIYGYTFMLNSFGDDTWTNRFYSFVIAGLITVGSYFLKRLPESSRVQWGIPVFSGLSIISLAVFCYYFAAERTGVTDTMVSLESIKSSLSTSDSMPFAFSLSILTFLIFVPTAIHCINNHPRRLADSRRYLAAYAPILSKDAEIKTTNLEIRKDESLLEQVQNFSDKGLKNLIYQSYHEGLTSFFPTQKKRDVLLKLSKQKQTSACGA